MLQEVITVLGQLSMTYIPKIDLHTECMPNAATESPSLPALGRQFFRSDLNAGGNNHIVDESQDLRFGTTHFHAGFIFGA
ncbi:hypothetical protein BLNAU_20534 [Blattamonas nauphoetae]|uniref:Uncharacterized protein n=1 Tax=Blattamonas nauphoetae TaxID=2049346 RepID=A0ABQ9WYD0_9EUKA|nr:hypothetical protein BLNAU_20534 [Blattamonas nauphoetae]